MARPSRGRLGRSVSKDTRAQIAPSLPPVEAEAAALVTGSGQRLSPVLMYRTPPCLHPGTLSEEQCGGRYPRIQQLLKQRPSTVPPTPGKG